MENPILTKNLCTYTGNWTDMKCVCVWRAAWMRIYIHKARITRWRRKKKCIKKFVWSLYAVWLHRTCVNHLMDAQYHCIEAQLQVSGFWFAFDILPPKLNCNNLQQCIFGANKRYRFYDWFHLFWNGTNWIGINFMRIDWISSTLPFICWSSWLTKWNAWNERTNECSVVLFYSMFKCTSLVWE